MILKHSKSQNAPVLRREYKAASFVVVTFLSITFVASAACLFMHRQPLLAQGEVESEQTEVAPKITGWVRTVYVRNGDQVKKGQTLALLENQDLQFKCEQARANVRLTNDQYHTAVCDARMEYICAQSNLWVISKEVAKRAERNLNYRRTLMEKGIVALLEVKDSETEWEVARSCEQAVKASLDLAVAEKLEEDFLAAAAKQEQATQAAAGLETSVAELKLTSPIDGEVQAVFLNVGDSASPGVPMVNIADLQNIRVTFRFREDLAPNIPTGGTFRVRVPALHNRDMLVKVVSISPKRYSAVQLGNKPTSDSNSKAFEVRAVPVESIEGLRPGMCAVWEIGKSS